MRLQGKVAIILGAGQSPGEGIGNGRATTLRFAEEGAKVLAVDRDLASAEETVGAFVERARIQLDHGTPPAEGGECVAHAADVTDERALLAAIRAAHERWGRLDILHYNVGVSLAGGDAGPLQITEEAFDAVFRTNLRGYVMACKHALPVLRQQGSGVILAISSVAAWADYAYVAYKASKAAMIAFTQQLAVQNAAFGIRANAILPGLMDTPMAVDTRARASGRSRAAVAAERNARVPLRGGMGNAWDVANAALFLASDEARFITGIALPVDGGTLARTG